MFRLIVSMMLRLFFYRYSSQTFSRVEIDEFERMYEQGTSNGNEINYTSSFPKYRFLQYVSLHKPVLLHGSNHSHIKEFETRKQTLFNGQFVEAVFATKDGIWPVFYAVLDRSKVNGDFRNACLEVENREKFYFFSLTKETLKANPWTQGMVYLLPSQSFYRASKSTISFDEWVSDEPVHPLTKLSVDPKDFYFINRVSCHVTKENIIKSWFLYKWRTWNDKESYT